MSTYREQVELCVDILERIVLALSPEQLAQNYRAALQAGLNHPHEKVKILALTQVGHYTHTLTGALKNTWTGIILSLFFVIGRSAEWWRTKSL